MVTSQHQQPTLTEVSEYAGQSIVSIVATGLGEQYTQRRRREIVGEWVEFFRSGPTPITSLTFWCRTPKSLFEALSGQSQLQALSVKWGDYDDLSVLQRLARLVSLRLGGAGRVVDLRPLGSLIGLQDLMIEDLKGTIDLGVLGQLGKVTDLEVGGNWANFHRVHVPDLSFLPAMPQLERLVLHTMVVDSADYSPLLSLPNLRDVRVAKTRNMRPPYDELRAVLPWSR